MRFEAFFWFGMLACALLGFAGWGDPDAAVVADRAASRSVVVERYAAKALELRNLTGSLAIESSGGSAVEVIFDDTPGGTAGLSRRLLGDTLVIAGTQPVTAVSGQGPSAPTTKIRVPHGLPVSILGHQGNIVSADLKGPLVLNLAEGVAALGQIRNARLSLSGDARIAAREAVGDLSIAVTGAGAVRIAQSLLEHLEVGVTGEGAVEVDGEARYASISLVGPGRIYLAEVERQPFVAQIGTGEIVIGSR